MRTRSSGPVRAGIAAAWAFALLALPARAQSEGSFAPECAARDLEVVILIEQRGRGEEVASERVAHAAMTMMVAREVCAAGRVDEALAVYDSIIAALRPMLSQNRP